MPDVYPIDSALLGTTGATNRIDDGIETVTDNAVDPTDTRVNELLNQLICNGFRTHQTSMTHSRESGSPTPASDDLLVVYAVLLVDCRFVRTAVRYLGSSTNTGISRSVLV